MVTKARTLGSAVSVGGVIQRDGAVKLYNTVDELPLSGNNIGDTAYVANFSRVYMWTGAGWFSIALINTSPSFDSGGTPEASYQLDSAGGTPLIIQLSATDPEDLPIEWSYVASDSAQYFADITNDSSVFTITAKDTATIQQYDSTGGTFSITFKASDGVNLATELSEFSITFNSFLNLQSYSVIDNTLDVSTHDTTTRGIRFKPDGTKFYLNGNSDIFREYFCSTPWNISTATPTGNTAALSSNSYGFHWSDDGAHIFAPRITTEMRQWTTATPWDITSLTLKSTTVVANGYHNSVTVNSAGTKIYATDYQTHYIYEYDMNTPFDITTASYNLKYFDMTTLGYTISAGASIYMRNDLELFLIVGGDNIVQMIFDNPGDITTLSLYDTLNPTSIFGTNPGGLSGMDFGNNNLYLTSYISDLLYQIN